MTSGFHPDTGVVIHEQLLQPFPEPRSDRAHEASKNFNSAAERLPTLFSLTEETVRILMLLEEGADDEPQLVEQLAEVEALLAEKLERCAWTVRDLEHLAAFRKADADRLRDQAGRIERASMRLKQRMLTHLQQTGQSRVETSRYTIAIRQNPYAVHVLEAAMVPKEYERTKILIDIDKRAILADFKASGVIPPGVEISRSQRLDIS